MVYGRNFGAGILHWIVARNQNEPADRGRDKVKLCPSLRTGLADLRHQMWLTTFDALCGLPIYVALSLPAVRVVRVS